MKSDWSTDFFHQSQTPNPYPPIVQQQQQPPHTSSSFFNTNHQLNSHYSSPIHQPPTSLHQPIPMMQNQFKASPPQSDQETAPTTPGSGSGGQMKASYMSFSKTNSVKTGLSYSTFNYKMFTVSNVKIQF